jgi:hypothetical protein
VYTCGHDGGTSMTEEQIKFMVNRVYRMIANADRMSFGDLINWADRCRLKDDEFLDILDCLEESKLVVRQGDSFSVSRAG